MNYADDPYRRRLIAQVLNATTLEEIEAATALLRDWVETHPDDLGIVDGFEQLSMLRDVAEEQVAQRTPVKTSRS